MIGERAVRLTSILALLIASTIQGLTPDAESVVSAFALQWLQLFAAAVDRDAAQGRIPDADRSTPSNDAHHDEAPDEVVLAIGAGTSTIPSRRLTDWHRRLFTSTGPGQPSTRPGPLLAGLSHGFSTPTTDLIISLCRMIC
jgi:hypothetical protein